VLAALRGTDEGARLEALRALESGRAPLDADICGALVELLADERKEVARRAAGALVHAAADPACRPLLERALADAHPQRRWCAAFALARSGVAGDRVFDVALDALGFSDGDVRWAAAEIVCARVRAAAAEEPDAARSFDALARLRAAACSPSAERRKMALYCLRDLGVADVTPFTAALEDSDRGVRLAALAGLARSASIPDTALRALTKAASSDSDDGVRRAAVVGLARRRAAVAPTDRESTPAADAADKERDREG